MRAATEAAGFHLAAVHPYEINPSALLAYTHNFSDSHVADQPQRTRLHLKNGEKKDKSCKTYKKARNLLGLTTEEWNSIKPDLVTMSPPCQPFTRQGLQLDISDSRSKPLAHILLLLSTVHHLPAMLLLENVRGFENSAARAEVIQVISQRGYLWQEFLLCPSQLGVPNSRLRYYLIAVLSSTSSELPSPESQTAVEQQFPVCLCLHQHQNSTSGKCESCNRLIIPEVLALLDGFHLPDSSSTSMSGLAEQTAGVSPMTYAQVTPTLEQFLDLSNSQTSLRNRSYLHEEQHEKFSSTCKSSEESAHKRELAYCAKQTSKMVGFSSFDCENESEFSISSDQHRDYPLIQDLSHFELKPKILAKYAMLLDIVDKTSRRTCCFTKGYGRLVEGTGSVYNPREKAELDAAFQCWISGMNCTEKNDSGERLLDCNDSVTSAMHDGVTSTGYEIRGNYGTGPSDLASADVEDMNSRKATECNSSEIYRTTIDGGSVSASGKYNPKNLADPTASSLVSGRIFPANTNHSVESLSVSSSIKDKELPYENTYLNEARASYPASFPSLSSLLSLKLRHFTSPECLRLMCFPSSFSFPSSLTQRQQYQLIGNSVNVLVVTVLLMYLHHWRKSIRLRGDGIKS
ncbi:S-adenosyl-L-methionine-dependent methyltransferase [Trinorchestia longiramus]|nr:S-adenosyl-L-methionine-dependent methyltransferase [Trinorchestia longiramus]